jgi:3D (Asp-Asp-Asp) domain-containing protein
MRFGKLSILGVLLSAIALLAIVSSTAIPTHAAAASSKTVTMYVTSYGYDDNSPPSADIAYPKSDGYPTKHNEATEGKGTYSDPVTFATDKSEIPVGSIVYVPFLEKYFVMEDDCAECDSDWSNSHKYHIDLWMGPQAVSNSNDLYACEDKITKDATSVILSPATNLTVDTTPLFKNNTCTAHLY